MKLRIEANGAAQTAELPDGLPLSESLRALGYRLNLACGGNNRCGRCRVRLLAGRFRIAGEPYDADREGPREANSCRIVPDGPEGVIAVPDSSLLHGSEQIETGFRPVAPSLATSALLPGAALAFDIGTTTVAAALVEAGRIVRTAGLPNAQGRFGDNVIDRIVAAGRSKEALAELRRVLVMETLNPLIAALAPSPGSIRRIAVAGNTVMSHLFCGLSPESIGVAPFRPLRLRFPVEPAGSFGFSGVDPDLPVYVWPALSGNVGGDVLGGIAVTGFGSDRTRTGLLLDLGTNCEMVLADRGKLLIASAAAGPAFEGSSSAVGCRARPGAVDHLAVSESGHFRFRVIGGDLRKLDGICGSGLVDFLAGMRRAGLLDEFGRYRRTALAALGRLETGMPGTGALCRLSARLAVSETDVEALLKAKAAIEAGTSALLRCAGKRPDDLDEIQLCGGFASALDLESAQAIGLLPRIPVERIAVRGNTALAAAALAASRPGILDEFGPERLNCTEIQFNELGFFTDLYTESLTLT